MRSRTAVGRSVARLPRGGGFLQGRQRPGSAAAELHDVAGIDARYNSGALKPLRGFRRD